MIAWILILTGCQPRYAEGWDAGCFDAGVIARENAVVDVAECRPPDPAVPDAVGSDTSSYGMGYASGFEACYADSYESAYTEAFATMPACVQ